MEIQKTNDIVQEKILVYSFLKQKLNIGTALIPTTSV